MSGGSEWTMDERAELGPSKYCPRSVSRTRSRVRVWHIGVAFTHGEQGLSLMRRKKDIIITMDLLILQK